MTVSSQSPASIRNLAAVDLGSNSFRMVIARVVGGQLQLVDRLREGVRLAASLDKDQRLTEEGQERALACLRKFGQRLREFPPGSVRAVGTNTLRKARNRDKFLRRASLALSHPIEVVSGQEEARLIYLGVSHSLPSLDGRRLVVDIGGGSTECIIGDAFDTLLTESLYMGCVSYSLAHFPDGRLKAKYMRRAETAARLELQALRKTYRKLGWTGCAGASGTIHAVHTILRDNGWSHQGITFDGLEKLRQAILENDHVDQLSIPGLRRDRAKVLPGGLAILIAVFETLEIERMNVSQGAMREGLLYDLLGRIRQEDVRNRTIRRFVDQYRVDVAQAARVEKTALNLLEQALKGWSLERESARLFLIWASSLHEVGLAVAHGGFQKHGGYLIANSDMPGFSLQDQHMLSLLVRSHRRKWPLDLFKELPKPLRSTAARLCVLLRLAVLLNRGRSSKPLPPIRLEAEKKKIYLKFPENWLAKHPLSLADLEQESQRLRAAGFHLRCDDLSTGSG